MPEKPDNLYCTFCGKAPREVRKLIAGPRVSICDECIKKCNDIIAQEAMKSAREDEPRRRVKPSSPALCCSFCGKQQHEAQTLIAGPSAYICDECIGLCNDIISEELDRADTAATLLATLPQNVRALIAGVLKRGLPAAARIRAVLKEQVTEDFANRVADGEPRNERIWGPWHLAGDWKDIHELVEGPASEENESHADDGLTARSPGAPSGERAEIPRWVPPNHRAPFRDLGGPRCSGAARGGAQSRRVAPVSRTCPREAPRGTRAAAGRPTEVADELTQATGWTVTGARHGAPARKAAPRNLSSVDLWFQEPTGAEELPQAGGASDGRCRREDRGPLERF